MTIDYFYTKRSEKPEVFNNWMDGGVPKSNFYIGMISQVYRDSAYIQVENLSLFNHRNIRLESLIPNSINYLVVIDSVQGLFIAEVYQSKVNSSSSVHEAMNHGIEETIYPEIAVNVIGILDGNKFKLSGLKTVGITDKVYIANNELISIYLKSIEINDYQKKSENEKISYQTSLENLMKLDGFENQSLSLKPNTLFDRHLMVVGTTNSGKSTSSLTILDKLVSANKKVLILDPTGEYQDSFEKEEIDKFTLGDDIFLKTASVDIQFWIDFFNVSSPEDSNKASVLSDAIDSLRYQKSNKKDSALKKDGVEVRTLLDKINKVNDKAFDLKLLPDQINNEAVKPHTDKKTGKYEFVHDGNLFNASLWLVQKVTYFLQSSLIEKFFNDNDEDDTQTDLFEKLKEFIKSRDSKSLYLNLSNISKTDTSGRTIVDLISKFIIDKKTTNDTALVLFIDELHRYVSRYSEESGLISIAREGRKKGIFLFLTTQNPKDVPEVLFGQIGTMVIHRLTHSEEIAAIQNYLNQNEVSQIPKLNQGEAILTSINLLQDIHVCFEKSGRKHDNDTPLL
ncbi:Bipolar DNA helicase [Fructilactobacillus florum 8D]|uniref:Bipolar DNA helicase n=1 Tax=Fructilactobacillus florum 8D TaxID=1221538 RepID=W9EES2_9LACO|nr:ATP-binding protein [Fructilactobacillus florum]ETO40628.1 Bipolar DNA helicase [Fructilactobacillus florum 8D]